MITTAALSAPRPRALPAAALIGAAVLLFVAAAAALTPLLLPMDPQRIVGDPVSGPTPRFWLGTNAQGHDLFSQMIYGAQTSLARRVFGGGAVSDPLGPDRGAAAGSRGRGRGAALTIIDLFLAMPSMPLAVLLIATLGPGPLVARSVSSPS